MLPGLLGDLLSRGILGILQQMRGNWWGRILQSLERFYHFKINVILPLSPHSHWKEKQEKQAKRQVSFRVPMQRTSAATSNCSSRHCNYEFVSLKASNVLLHKGSYKRLLQRFLWFPRLQGAGMELRKYYEQWTQGSVTKKRNVPTGGYVLGRLVRLHDVISLRNVPTS